MRFIIELFCFLSADNEAIDVKWEIIDDDQEIEVNKPIEKDQLGITRYLIIIMIIIIIIIQYKIKFNQFPFYLRYQLINL